MAKQTLVQAIYLAFSGRDHELQMALGLLTGCPVGAWGETRQARLQVAGQLPPRRARAYTLDDFIDAAWVVSQSGRYQLRSAEDAQHEAAAIEALKAAER
jgi:hypothetical protein